MPAATKRTPTNDATIFVAVDESDDDDDDDPPATSGGVSMLIHFLPLPSSGSAKLPVSSVVMLRSRWFSTQSATLHSLAGSAAERKHTNRINLPVPPAPVGGIGCLWPFKNINLFAGNTKGAVSLYS